MLMFSFFRRKKPEIIVVKDDEKKPDVDIGVPVQFSRLMGRIYNIMPLIPNGSVFEKDGLRIKIDDAHDHVYDCTCLIHACEFEVSIPIPMFEDWKDGAIEIDSLES